MVRRIFLIALAGIACRTGTGIAAPVGAELTDEQIRAAAVSEQFSMPSPSEVFVVFEKKSKPDWSALFKKSPAIPFTSRPQIALNLGVLITDGYLAAEAQDGQEIKNISREIRILAKRLGVDHDLVTRNNSIADLADARRWDSLAGELEAVQNDLSAAMSSRQDSDFASLMALGGWLRSVEIVSGQLAAHYEPSETGALRQPAVGNYFVQRLAAMPARIRESPMIAEVQRGVSGIRESVSFPAGQAPSPEDVAKLKNLATTILTSIGTLEK